MFIPILDNTGLVEDYESLYPSDRWRETFSYVKTSEGDLVSSSVRHDAVICPKERAATIIAQVDHEMARIKERDHHWEDGIEVRL